MTYYMRSILFLRNALLHRPGKGIQKASFIRLESLNYNFIHGLVRLSNQHATLMTVRLLSANTKAARGVPLIKASLVLT